MTIEEQLAEQKAYLTALKQVRTDLVASGLPVRVELGNRIITYSKIENVTKEITRVSNSIIILEREIY